MKKYKPKEIVVELTGALRFSTRKAACQYQTGDFVDSALRKSTF